MICSKLMTHWASHKVLDVVISNSINGLALTKAALNTTDVKVSSVESVFSQPDIQIYSQKLHTSFTLSMTAPDYGWIEASKCIHILMSSRELNTFKNDGFPPL